jgi:hypothetical protein
MAGRLQLVVSRYGQKEGFPDPMVKKYGGAGRVGERSSWGPAGLVGRRGAKSSV